MQFTQLVSQDSYRMLRPLTSQLGLILVSQLGLILVSYLGLIPHAQASYQLVSQDSYQLVSQDSYQLVSQDSYRMLRPLTSQLVSQDSYQLVSQDSYQLVSQLVRTHTACLGLLLVSQLGLIAHATTNSQNPWFCRAKPLITNCSTRPNILTEIIRGFRQTAAGNTPQEFPSTSFSIN